MTTTEITFRYDAATAAQMFAGLGYFERQALKAKMQRAWIKSGKIGPNPMAVWP
jgi:hypothetical protein